MRLDDLPAALRFVRDARHISQVEAGEQTAVARSTLDRIEKGRANLGAMTYATLERIEAWIAHGTIVSRETQE